MIEATHMNKNYCGKFKITEENRLDPEAPDKLVGIAFIEGPIPASSAGEFIIHAIVDSLHRLHDPNFPLAVDVIDEFSIPDDLRGVEPTLEDGDTKVWLIKP